MMWGPDRPLWQSVLSIWFGMVQIARVKQFLIKSQWKRWLDLLEHWVSVRRRSLLTFLRKPWNPLSCNSITIHLRGGATAAARRLQESFYWHMWPSALGWTIKRATFGGQKSPFTLGQPWATKSLNSITEIASANTYRHTYQTHPQTLTGHEHMRMQLHAQTCIHADTHTHTYIQMKGNEMAANPSTLDRNQFPTWNLCWGVTLIGGQIRACLLLIRQATATHVP